MSRSCFTWFRGFTRRLSRRSEEAPNPIIPEIAAVVAEARNARHTELTVSEGEAAELRCRSGEGQSPIIPEASDVIHTELTVRKGEAGFEASGEGHTRIIPAVVAEASNAGHAELTVNEGQANIPDMAAVEASGESHTDAIVQISDVSSLLVQLAATKAELKRVEGVAAAETYRANAIEKRANDNEEICQRLEKLLRGSFWLITDSFSLSSNKMRISSAQEYAESDSFCKLEATHPDVAKAFESFKSLLLTVVPYLASQSLKTLETFKAYCAASFVPSCSLNKVFHARRCPKTLKRMSYVSNFIRDKSKSLPLAVDGAAPGQMKPRAARGMIKDWFRTRSYCF
jgi:hypothetical protein